MQRIEVALIGLFLAMAAIGFALASVPELAHELTVASPEPSEPVLAPVFGIVLAVGGLLFLLGRTLQAFRRQAKEQEEPPVVPPPP